MHKLSKRIAIPTTSCLGNSDASKAFAGFLRAAVKRFAPSVKIESIESMSGSLSILASSPKPEDADEFKALIRAGYQLSHTLGASEFVSAVATAANGMDEKGATLAGLIAAVRPASPPEAPANDAVPDVVVSDDVASDEDLAPEVSPD